MNHPAELALHQYMEKAANGGTDMSPDTIKQVAQDVSDALQRQFGARVTSEMGFAYACLMWADPLANSGLNVTSQKLRYSKANHIRNEHDDW